ncbi:hypothetical protein, partial [Pseudomonas gingeri]|uniref:hypothetical protein n=1 Tax=Pseudomonas gingeri TaxID=117681 RepID=UPI001C42E73A
DAMGRKAWQFASTLPVEKLSGVHSPGVNTSLLVEHAYNPIHRRYQYDPAGELVRNVERTVELLSALFGENSPRSLIPEPALGPKPSDLASVPLLPITSPGTSSTWASWRAQADKRCSRPAPMQN